jgi:hypothetical protein
LSQFNAAYHEAAHAVAAHAAGFPLRMLSIHENADSIGITFLGDGDTDDFIACAAVLVAGELGEKKALGQTVRFNWFADAGEDDGKHFDANKARAFCDDYVKASEGEDVLDVRHYTEHRAYRLVVLQWPVIQALAEQLERKKLLMGEDVERIINETKKGGKK